MNVKGKVVIVMGLAAAAILAASAVGFACTNLATLNLSAAQGKPGDVVTVTGSSFNTRAPVSDDVLRWNGVDGPELARVQPDRVGNISASFTVPNAQPGYYVLVATQKDQNGIDTYGTPARASYLILGLEGQNLAQPVSAPEASVVDESSSTGMLALTVGLGVLGLVLFGAGFAGSCARPAGSPKGRRFSAPERSGRTAR